MNQAPQVARVGKPAPNFDVETAVAGGAFARAKLEDFKGRWLVLFFYPLDFTFVCPTEITGFSKRSEEFRALSAEVLGGSTDSVHSHKAWLKELGDLAFPLFSDMHRTMSSDYGVLLEEKGIALRGTFIIDPDGILRYALYHDLGVGRSVSETLRVLTALQTGELCPVEWNAGGQTLGKV
ncbi:peroxiredoxin [Candidatus Uhrbacteria bacterium]|nr:peroxiredoxin [Candidatus Uhrbacteria bacterium]